MLRDIFSNLLLIKRLAFNDFRGRYYGSALGLLWAVVKPLTMIVMYTLIFAVVLKVKVGAKGSVTDFGLFLICGMIPFNAVADSIRSSTGVYLDQSHLMRRIPMPPAVLPAARVLTSFMEMAIVLALFFILLVITGRSPGALAPGFLVLVPMQAMIALGLAVAAASLTVMVRDISSLSESLLTIWFLGTPVFYPRALVPGMLRQVSDANPMTAVVEGYRAFILHNQLPSFDDVLYLSLVSIFFLLAGSWVYGQTRARIIDHV